MIKLNSTSSEEELCDYVATPWSCGGSGYLWLADEIPAASGKYPCPKCNTEVFLRKAKMIAQERLPIADVCPCCEPVGPSATDVWRAAVSAAIVANPLETEKSLAAIGRVTLSQFACRDTSSF